MRELKLRNSALLVLSGLVLAKLWLMQALPLFGDEAFYWLEAQYLAPAYDDVPALTPWLIALGTALGGDVVWAVRAPFLLLSLLTLGLLWQMARELDDRARNVQASATKSRNAQSLAWMSVLIAALLPLLAANGLLALPDVALNLSFVLCLYGLQRFRLAPGGFAMLLLGAGLALGWLSHYRFVVLLGAAASWLLMTGAGRQLLRDRRFWLAGGVGNLLGLAPLLWQQWQSSGAGLAFQFAERHPWQFQPPMLAEPLLQALITSPLLYGLLLWAGVRGMRRPQHPALRMYAQLGLLVLLLYWGLGLFADSERSRLHWPLPGYIALCLPLAAMVVSERRWNLMLSGLLLAAAMIGAGAGVMVVSAAAPERLASGKAYFHNLSGWDEATDWARSLQRDQATDSVVVADNFMLAAQLQFGLGDSVRVYSLDHSINRKHGRQGELRRMQRDEASIPAASALQPVLILAEESETSLRQRPAWFSRLCQRFPHAQRVDERTLHHDRKRLIAWLDRGPSEPDRTQPRCLPPALGYIDRPRWGDVMTPGAALAGWALRGETGVDEVRAVLGKQTIALRYRIELPTLPEQLGGQVDPFQPALGFDGVLPATLAPGNYWLRLQARNAGGEWSTVAASPFRVVAVKE